MTIIAPQRGTPVANDDQIPTIRFASFLEDMTRDVNTLAVDVTAITANENPYTVSNVTTDRVFDATQAAGTITNPPTQAEVENIRDAVLEMADVLGTLIADLKTATIVP